MRASRAPRASRDSRDDHEERPILQYIQYSRGRLVQKFNKNISKMIKRTSSRLLADTHQDGNWPNHWGGEPEPAQNQAGPQQKEEMAAELRQGQHLNPNLNKRQLSSGGAKPQVPAASKFLLLVTAAILLLATEPTIGANLNNNNNSSKGAGPTRTEPAAAAARATVLSLTKTTRPLPEERPPAHYQDGPSGGQSSSKDINVIQSTGECNFWLAPQSEMAL